MSPNRPVARAVAVLAALVAGAGVALHHSRSEIPAVPVLASFAVAAWAFSLVALIAALRARSVLLGIIAVVLVGAGVVQYGPLVAPPRQINDDEGIPMRVMVQNLEFGRAAPHDVVRAVRTGGVDLLMTVETTPEAADALRTAGLTGLLPHEAASTAPTTQGVAVWSRFPLSPPERVPGFSLGLVRTEMAGPGGPVTVVAAHPVAPVFDAPAAVEEADRLRWSSAAFPGPRRWWWAGISTPPGITCGSVTCGASGTPTRSPAGVTAGYPPGRRVDGSRRSSGSTTCWPAGRSRWGTRTPWRWPGRTIAAWSRRCFCPRRGLGDLACAP